MSSLTDINLDIDTTSATAANQGQGQVSQGALASTEGGNVWLYWWVGESSELASSQGIHSLGYPDSVRWQHF